jgi:hypothetical protein
LHSDDDEESKNCITHKKARRSRILILAEIAPTLSVKMAAVICLLKMRKF